MRNLFPFHISAWLPKKSNTFLELKRQVRLASKDLKIVVGAGGLFDSGWIPTDVDMLDLLKEEDWKRLFRKNTIAAILAEHVWEHLSLEEGAIAVSNCYKYLRMDGYLRIAVPDGFHPDPAYIEYVKVGGSGCGAGDHKVLYNYQTLQKLLETAGFQVKLLEYFDENGNFYFKDWDPAHGKIYRSKNFDSRNMNGELKYTSLIADAIKPHKSR